MENYEAIKSFMEKDVYATTTTGCKIEELSEGYAKCSLKIEPKILNATGNVMGGAIYTLADYVYGVACHGVAVTQTANITYLAATKGTELYAEAKCIKDGRTIVYYEVKVTDDLGKLIAVMTVSGVKVK